MGTPFSWHPGIPPIPNFWYPNNVITTAAGGSSLTTGQMHFYPVMVSVPHAYQNIGVWAAVAQQQRVGGLRRRWVEACKLDEKRC